MRLVDRKTKVEIKEGDEVERGRETMRVSGLDPKHGRIFLIDLEADRSPVALPPSAIGAKFAP
jgi:hypothetical protein